MVTRKWSDGPRQSRALFVSFASHDGSDCTAEGPSFDAIVTETVAHDERSEVRVAEPKRAENMRVFRDLFDRITRVIDNDFLRSNENAHRRLETLDIKVALRGFELHQIQRSQIARSIIEEQIFRARVRGILTACAFAGVPFVDRRIELHPRIATDVCSFGNLAQQGARLFAFARFAVRYAARPPFAPFQRCVHKFIAYPHAYIFVLIHDRAVRIAVITAIVAVLDQRPCLLFFLLFRVDELFDVRVPIFERVHLCSTPCLTAALHYVRNLIVNFQERERSARLAAAAQFFPC